MTVLRLFRGLPASGKTTQALQWLRDTPEGEHRARSNRDDLRASVFGGEGVLTFEQEQLVTRIQRAQVRSLLQAKVSVVVDDTNLRLKFAREWANVAAEEGVDFEVIEVDTGVETCVQRDKLRGMLGEHSVGEEVIREIDRRFRDRLPVVADRKGGWEERKFPLYVPDMNQPEAWIVDIDGTLADRGDHPGHRDWHDETRVSEDQVHEAVRDLVLALDDAGYQIVAMSGRTKVCYDDTLKWLNAAGIFPAALIMRDIGDQRDDAVVKNEMFERDVAPQFWVRGTIDDRDKVVAMWRAKGIVCAQVAEGNF